MGNELRFLIEATDPDLGTTLSFAASDLPEGATVDPDTGEFVWTPGPGQAGIYTVGLHVSDSVTTSSQAIVILADIELPAPAVTVELTPSFPALEGDIVLVHAIADSLADIVDLVVTFDGTPLAAGRRRAGTYLGTPTRQIRDRRHRHGCRRPGRLGDDHAESA